MKDFRRLVGAGLLTLVALLLTLKFKAALDWSPDFIIPVLVVSGFLLNIYSLAFLVILVLWVLNWQIGLPPELWIFVLAPLAALLGKKFMPSAPWLTLAVIIAVSEIAIYALADGSVFLSNIDFIASNVVFAVVLGLALLTLLEWVYEERNL